MLSSDLCTCTRHVVVRIDNVLTTVFSNPTVVASIRLYCGEPIFLLLSTKIKARL